MRYFTLTLAVCFGALLSAAPTHAQHDHGDIEFTYANGRIEIEFGHEGAVFEGEIDATGGFANETHDPGFGSEVEEGLGVNPDDLIGYNVHGPLLMWDGTQFVSAGGASMTIEDALSDTLITANSGDDLAEFTTPNNVIAQADDAGDVHAHVEFVLSDATPGAAYGVILSLATDEPGIADSAPFGILFNYGDEGATAMDHELFEDGVEALAARVVPEPSSLLLMAGALLLPLGRRN